MSEQTKARYAFDLDDLEKQLRQTAGSQPKAVPSDPLADLARIVGQDDPFKAMFADKRNVAMPPLPVQVAPPAPRRVEPTLDDILYNPKPSTTLAADAAGAEKPLLQQDMLDEFDKLLQDELRGSVNPAETAAIRADVPLPARQEHGLHEFRDLLTRDDVVAGKAASSVRDLDDRAIEFRADENLPRDLGQPLEAADYPEPPEDQPADMRSLEPQQPRKGLVIAMLLLGVAALGVGTVVGLRGLSGPARTTGEAPVIRADAGPTKVAPQNPGGVEIPNQNKQIYERTPEPKAGEARVVTREEQPVDLQATARAAARVILPGPGAAAPASPVAAAPAATVAPEPVGVAAVPAAPLQQAAAPPATALGEPRRVRTIAVRPDGTIAPANGTPAAAAAAPVTPQAAPAAPRPAPAVTASAPAPASRPPAPRAAVDETPAPRPVPPRTQVAAAPAAAPVPAPRATEPAQAGGGFMVQLGAPGSEAEARSTFASLQRRFSDQLSSDSPVIRRADVGNGRTVYRLRVGPFSREEAAEKCQALQAAGGQCFIARN